VINLKGEKMKDVVAEIGFLGDTLFPICPVLTEDVERTLLDTNFNICNYEGASIYNKILERKKDDKLILLGSNSEKMISGLKALNIKGVSLANNHFFDNGYANAQETILELQKNDISTSGVYSRANGDIEKLAIIEFNNKKFGMLSYGWSIIGCKGNIGKLHMDDLNIDIIAQDIEAARSRVDFLIVSVHWGYEFELYPHPAHRVLAHKMIDLGVDVIVGHHPHIIQGIEEYNEKLIMYSLGNFFLPQVQYNGVLLSYTRPEANIGLAVKLKIYNNMDYEYSYKGIRYESKTHSLSEEAIDISPISNFGNLNDLNYRAFFKQRRLRKRGLPIFYGDRMDNHKGDYVLFRQKIIEILVRKKLRRKK
jgi:poly-gamma-glutamate synthesis protein (capsule biosynthesis protein)